MPKRIIIVDGNAYIHRAYHALPPLSTSKGEQVNAVYGFIRMMLKLMRNDRPDYLLVCFDFPGKTFRHELYKEYKATRKKADEELVGQFPIVREAVNVLGIASVEKEGYEADDIIATIVEKLKTKDIEITVISGDKDILQLVEGNVKVLNEHKNIVFSRDKVFEKFGLYPEQLVDYFSLCGDKSDNVYGVPGVGKKTAVKLLQENCSIEKIFENIDKPQSGYSQNLLNNIRESRQKLFLNRKLIELNRNVSVEIDIDRYVVSPADQVKLVDFIKRYEFNALLRDFILAKPNLSEKKYHVVYSEAEFCKLKADLKVSMEFSIIVFYDNGPAFGNMIGLAFSLGAGSGYYVPVGHSYLNAPGQLTGDFVNRNLRDIVESEKIGKLCFDSKKIISYFNAAGISPKGITFDAMIASYLDNPARAEYGLESIAIDLLGEKLEDTNSSGKQKAKSTKGLMGEIPVEEFYMYACSCSDLILRISEKLKHVLQEKGLADLFFKIELPLVYVLSGMEKTGIKINAGYLKSLGTEFGLNSEKLIKEIYSMSGQEFNINSPKQLSFVLFEKLKLPVISRTKTGFSTNESVLRALSGTNKIAQKIIDFRELQKLQSTYVDGLLGALNPSTGRVHTSFNQTGTVTGRLSSSEPNMQNIPIRSELGRKIRQSFISEDGYFLVSADYSQIDLRVLAHFSGDKALCDAFDKHKDVHSSTASELFGVTISEVTPDLRRIAKTINFGIIYGLSAFGLSEQLGISKEDAARYIGEYFIKYEGVKKWIDQIIQKARHDGYVKTLFSRIRYLPEINSRNNQLRSFAERMAMNAPIQGTAADIIKVAMINIFGKTNNDFRMLLQVHDELLFEVRENIVEETMGMIKYEMENAVKLCIPVVADLKFGKNWNEMEKYE